MKFGLVEDFRNPPQWQRPYPELYQDLLDQIAHLEDLGYDNIWLTEHHFTEDGYNPSLFPTAAAIAARTQRIRIGTFIVLLPFQHPVRVAEDATSVDIFSNGRFDLGVGLAGSSMPAFADDLAFAHDDGTDSRVRRSQPPPLAGQTQCFAHPLVIIHGSTGNIRIRCFNIVI